MVSRVRSKKVVLGVLNTMRCLALFKEIKIDGWM